MSVNKMSHLFVFSVFALTSSNGYCGPLTDMGDVGARITVVVTGFALVSLVFKIVQPLTKDGKWLSKLLSEPEPVVVNPAVPADSTTPAVPASTEFVPSSSRFIAFIGSIVMLVLFVAFGLVVLWNFAKGTAVDSETLGNIGNFLLTGMSLFAPYGVNKVGNMFKGK